MRGQYNKSALVRLFKLLLPYRRQFFLGLLALACGSGINLLFPVLIRNFLNSQGVNSISQHPWFVALGLISLFAIQGLFFYARSFQFGVVGQQAIAKVRSDLYQATLRQDLEAFDAQRTADLVSRLNTDCMLIQDAVGTKISVLLRYGLQVLIGILAMTWLSIKLTLAIIFLLPLIVVFSAILGKKLGQLSKKQQAALGSVNAIAEETLTAVKIVKAFGQDSFEIQRFNQQNQNVLQAGLARTALASFFASFVNFLMNACIVAVLIFGVYLVQQQKLSLGDLTAFMLYGTIVGVSFAFFTSAYTELLQASGAAERVFDLIDKPPPKITRAAPKKLPQQCVGKIEFNQVKFAYPSRSDTVVLNNLSLAFPAGKTTALVGSSGSGKSSIVNLLLRFYDPLSGSITIDELDLRDIDPEDLRKQFALVPQDPLLFGVSLEENLKYGKPDATAIELSQACSEANILDFIQSLPQGFKTLAGDHGTQLSGGQKQRIALARAILRNPKILILDEATSALDSENEAQIYHSLGKLMQGRTVIIIAHRLATVKHADQVLVLEQGKLIQQGTHSSLLQQSGFYRQLVEQQELSA